MSRIGMSRRTSKVRSVIVALIVFLFLASFLYVFNQNDRDNNNVEKTTTAASNSASANAAKTITGSNFTNTVPNGSATGSSTGADTNAGTSPNTTLASAGLKIIQTEAYNVYDGDTFHVLVNGTDEKVRVMGIDTPEMDAISSLEKTSAIAARDYTASLVDGKKVYLVCETANYKDTYNRILAYVWLTEPSDTLDRAKAQIKDTLNGKLLANGYATTMFIGTPIFKTELQACYDASKRTGQEAATTSGTSVADSAGASAQSSANSSSTGVKGLNGEYYIKGNISTTTGEKIYHMPGQKYYDATIIDESKGERWFRSEAEAQAAGWRKSKV
ncbi:MAG: thermonuclease family protein [Coriobacteriales bacterium]|jgi:micrococcal nuclease|nr:thermonuclease family protein [Coriobacteriales bacterium]